MTSGVLTFLGNQNGFLPFVEGLMAEALAIHSPILLNDTQIFDARSEVTNLDQFDLKALAVLPIPVKGEGLGALAMARGKEFGSAFSDMEIQLGLVASQILGLILTNIQLWQRSQKEFVRARVH